MFLGSPLSRMVSLDICARDRKRHICMVGFQARGVPWLLGVARDHIMGLDWLR